MANTANYAFHGVATTGIFSLELLEARDAATVVNRSTTEIYFTVSSDVAPTAPSVTGADSYVVPGVVGAKQSVEAGPAPIYVALTCSGSAAFSVIGGQPGLVIER